MINEIKIETLEVAGLGAALQAVRLPHNGKVVSKVANECGVKQHEDGQYVVSMVTAAVVDPKDIKLIQALNHKGDQHAKVLRGILVWAKITAPVYWWCEAETYGVGHQRLSSASTMHTEGKGLQGEELQKVKAEIPMGRELTKIDYFSYQTLRRMVYQRHNHRLPEWHQFCNWVKTLPFAEELILDGLDKMDNGDPELK